MELLREYCNEDYRRIPQAIAAGARRIEFCDRLDLGGVTPESDDIERVVSLAHARGASVMVMDRPRGGSFVCDGAERGTMLDTITSLRSLHADGVVLGCLKEGDRGQLVLDDELVRQLVDAAKDTRVSSTTPLQVTFHMAFDELGGEAQLAAIDALAAMGVDRILTHGGPAGTPILNNIAHLQELVAHASGRLVIMPGGGVTWENAEQIARLLGTCEVHGTKIVRM